MKKNYSSLIKGFVFISVLNFTFSCDEDYTEIGADVVNNQDILIQNQSYPAKTYNKRIMPFQSNGLPGYLLGHYNDPNFGSTNSHFLGQLTPSTYNPDFGDNTVLDSVVLTIPYFSRVDDDINVLDSLYGDSSINLSIHKNNFFLRNFDPGSDLDESQAYYSNGTMSSLETLNNIDLEGQLIYSDSEFIPNNNDITLVTRDEDGEILTSETLSPSLRIKLEDNLPDNFWKNLIFDKEESDELSSANAFYNYFRGLYFKAESNSSGNGSLVQMDFGSANAHLKLHYTYETTTTTTDQSTGETTDEITERQGSYDLRFSGNNITIFDNDFSSSFLDIINNANENEGDQQIYLKGGEGSMAVVELFSQDEDGNDFDDFISDFREIFNEGEPDEERVIKRLINEAYLEFYIDESAMQADPDYPNRIYIHDLENNIPLIDYFEDPTVNTTTSDSKFYHLVPLTTETDEEGNEHKKYKVRLTKHLKNIIVSDFTNLKLGLFVSSNVGATNPQKLLDYDSLIKGIPSGSVLSPKGIVLHGSNSDNAIKSVELKVYYTQINN